ncbi:hypothetical protein BDF19DRAFT_446366, partial [Syncephalis fuscata]
MRCNIMCIRIRAQPKQRDLFMYKAISRIFFRHWISYATVIMAFDCSQYTNSRFLMLLRYGIIISFVLTIIAQLLFVICALILSSPTQNIIRIVA